MNQSITDSENGYSEDDEDVSDLNDEMLYSSDSSDEEDSEFVGKFDDEALIEFVRKGQKFRSIDLMIQMEYCSG